MEEVHVRGTVSLQFISQLFRNLHVIVFYYGRNSVRKNNILFKTIRIGTIPIFM